MCYQFAASVTSYTDRAALSNSTSQEDSESISNSELGTSSSGSLVWTQTQTPTAMLTRLTTVFPASPTQKASKIAAPSTSERIRIGSRLSLSPASFANNSMLAKPKLTDFAVARYAV